MKKKFHLRKAPFVLISFFILVLTIGITMGEPTRVLELAKAICLSCIGIG